MRERCYKITCAEHYIDSNYLEAHWLADPVLSDFILSRLYGKYLLFKDSMYLCQKANIDRYYLYATII